MSARTRAGSIARPSVRSTEPASGPTILRELGQQALAPVDVDGSEPLLAELAQDGWSRCRFGTSYRWTSDRPGASPRRHPVGRACCARAAAPSPMQSPPRPYVSSGSASNSRTADAFSEMHKPGSDADASEPGIFAERVSISSTRSAGVSDSAYFIKSIELRPTFDLFLGASRGLQFSGRASSGETPIVWWFCRTHRSPDPQPTQAGGRARPSGMRRRSVIVAEPAWRRRLRWRRGY